MTLDEIKTIFRSNGDPSNWIKVGSFEETVLIWSGDVDLRVILSAKGRPDKPFFAISVYYRASLLSLFPISGGSTGVDKISMAEIIKTAQSSIGAIEY